MSIILNLSFSYSTVPSNSGLDFAISSDDVLYQKSFFNRSNIAMEQGIVDKFAPTFWWSSSKNFASDLHLLIIINLVGTPFTETKSFKTMKSDCK